MYRGRAYAIPSMTPVKSDGEEDIRSLGPAVGDPLVVRCPHKVGIFEVDVGEAVPGRREVDQTPSLADKWRDTVDEYEVPQMIGAELHFKAVRRMTKWRGHHSCISDDYVEGFTLFEQSFGARSSDWQDQAQRARNFHHWLQRPLAPARLPLRLSLNPVPRPQHVRHARLESAPSLRPVQPKHR